MTKDRNNKLRKEDKQDLSDYKHSKVNKLIKVLFITCVFVFFLVGVNLGYNIYDTKKEPKKIVKTEWGKVAFDIPQSKKTVNVLAMGFDKSGLRTDTMMVANFDPVTSEVNLISIPRDTLVGIDGRRMKINAVFPRGDFELTLKTVRELTNLPIHYYVAVDTSGFKKIINDLGGVRFNVPKDMYYYDPYQNLEIDLEKGPQLLDGEKAEQLVRYRRYTMGDLERENIQKKFVKALIDQKLNINNISDLSKVKQLYNNFRTYVKTNVGLKDVMKYFKSALKVNSQKINTYTLPGQPCVINGTSYYVYNEKKTMNLYEKIIGEDFKNVDQQIRLNNGIEIYNINKVNKILEKIEKEDKKEDKSKDNTQKETKSSENDI